VNFLSSNIKFLRKRRKLSQQRLADDLGIKRSNIAAYETKNVEPRLSFINELADYFEIPLEDMVLTDLKSRYAERGEEGLPGGNVGLSADSIDEIRQIANKVQRMLDGFKVFYEFKRRMNEQDAGADDGDIDNFLIFINHMSEYNRLIEDSLNGAEPSGGGGAVLQGARITAPSLVAGR
jgi:transcriptional regulator with XRE-family HTH domain